MDDNNNDGKKGSPDKVTTDQPINSEDEWNLDSLRLDQSFDQMIGAEQVLTTVPVRKPSGQEFFQVNRDPSYRLQAALLHNREDNEVFIVEPHLVTELWEELFLAILFTAVTRQGAVFLWPVRLPKQGLLDRFSEKDIAAAKIAQTKWVRRFWVPEIKEHKILAAVKLTDQPVWPDASFKELLKIAFQDRRIKSLDHPIIKRLRGEI